MDGLMQVSSIRYRSEAAPPFPPIPEKGFLPNGALTTHFATNYFQGLSQAFLVGTCGAHRMKLFL